MWLFPFLHDLSKEQNYFQIRTISILIFTGEYKHIILTCNFHSSFMRLCTTSQFDVITKIGSSATLFIGPIPTIVITKKISNLTTLFELFLTNYPSQTCCDFKHFPFGHWCMSVQSTDSDFLS